MGTLCYCCVDHLGLDDTKSEMTDTYRTPILNLKAVVQETGVKPDTLRAWERRHGLPAPGRSASGHRLYSQRDVDVIKWLVARQEEGLTIGRAVDLWRQLEADGQQPLRDLASGVSAPFAGADSALGEMRRAWVSACLAFDEIKAKQVLTRAFALYPPEMVGLELLLNGIADIGRGWYEGTVTVQQEHFASTLAVRQIEALLLSTPPSSRAGRILAACPSEEEHVLALLMFSYLMRRRGWDVLYLGASVPQEQMQATVEATRPRLVVLAAQQLHTASNLSEMAQALQQMNVTVGFGGGIFDSLPTLRSHIPGHFLGATLEEGAFSAEGLMTTAQPTPALTAAPRDHQAALRWHRDHRLTIEAEVWKWMRPSGIEHDTVLVANEQFSRAMGAALALGDIHYLDHLVAWLRGMGPGLHIADDVLTAYLTAYRRAAEAHWDERGELIVRWLSAQVDAGTLGE